MSRHCEEHSDEAKRRSNPVIAKPEGLKQSTATWRRSAVADVVQAWRRGRSCGAGLGRDCFGLRPRNDEVPRHDDVIRNDEIASALRASQ